MTHFFTRKFLLSTTVRSSFAARVVAAVSLATAFGLTAGCSASAQPQTDPITLVVRDDALRGLGDDCAGSGPLMGLHAGALLVVIDDTGDSVFEQQLPTGTAIAADTKDYGQAPRVPTHCSFDISGATVLASETYTVKLDGTDLGVATTIEGLDGHPVLVYPRLGDASLIIGDGGQN